ncbi:MAG: glycerol-3-phosphate acyltransferase [Planctomycetota bacterium]|nr:MAG: glycerol-3-phosphate acyltransferase [Planctomycetota bacterium]
MLPVIAWLVCLAAYLFASISFAWLVARAHGINLREHGSGNLGATNVGRVLGGRWFALVFAADVLKGLLPVLLMHYTLSLGQWPESAAGWWLTACAAAAVIGHIAPCWHGFRGGKAVATSLGVIIALSPLVAAAAAVAWCILWGLGVLLGLGRSGAVAPASVAAAITAAAMQWWWYGWSEGALPITLLVVVAAVLVVLRHRSNMRQFLRPSAST